MQQDKEYLKCCIVIVSPVDAEKEKYDLEYKLIKTENDSKVIRYKELEEYFQCLRDQEMKRVEYRTIIDFRLDVKLDVTAGNK